MTEPESRADERPSEFVRSLEKGLSVIQAFTHDLPSLTLSEVAKRTGLTRASARRFLLTLEALHYVRTEGNRYRLTPRVLDLGYAYLSSTPLWNIALGHLEDLVRETGESGAVSVLDGVDVVLTLRIPVQRLMSLQLSVGTRLPAYPTSMGRVLLAGVSPAELDAYFAKLSPKPLTKFTVTSEYELRQIIAQVRKDGYAIVDQEMEEGVRAISVPICTRSGKTLAALNLGTHMNRLSVEEMVQVLLPPMLHTASAIQDQLVIDSRLISVNDAPRRGPTRKGQ